MSIETNDPVDSLRVLIVDDSEEVRHLLARGLRRLGHEVVVAENGEEGLKLLAEQSFPIVFTDIQMPGIDGHTLLRRLASQDLDTAVVVISGTGTMDDVVDVLRAGAVDYLKKPWNASALVSALGRAEEVFAARQKTRAAKAPVLPTVTAAKVEAAPLAHPPSLFSSLLDQIRNGQIVLPSVPLVVRKLRDLIARPNADVDAIAALIEQDPSLATQLLRLSNTAAYAHLGRNQSIGGALSRIGLRQVQSLVETITAHRCFELRTSELRPLQAHIAQDSLAKALCFRALAELLGPTHRLEPEVAYMTGLLGDAGASFLLWVVGEHSVGSPTVPTEAACLDLLQTHHQEVGGRILERWGMDPPVVLLAQTHHADSPPAPPSDYWTLAVLGTDLADRIGPGSDPTRKGLRRPALLERCGAELCIGSQVMRKLEDRLRDEFQSMSEALS